MKLWEARVRSEVNSAGSLLQPALRNTISRFIDLLGDAFSDKASRGMSAESAAILKVHAGDRARDTAYGPKQVVQELGLLKEVITAELERHFHLSDQDYETIRKTFEQATQEALMEFFLVHAGLREQFMATLSHDLRGPLSVASMGAQMARKIAAGVRDEKQSRDLAKQADQILQSLKRVDGMIQDLLDVSVLRAGEKIPIRISNCDLLAIAREATAVLSEDNKARVRVLGEPAKGFWDADGLRRSVENLVTNAIKYGAEGTPVTIRISREGDKARLSVHNEGNPISEQDQQQLFRAYRRAKSAVDSGQKGWGIGLALAQGVAESLGGRIDVRSSLEEGTTFTIELPEDSRIHQEAHGARSSARSRSRRRGSGSGERGSRLRTRAGPGSSRRERRPGADPS